MFLGGFYVTVISPLVFNYILIPRIEEKVHKELKYPDYLEYIVLGYFLYRHIFVAKYIIRRYIAYKFKGEMNIPPVASRTTLGRVGYTIKMMSKMEIFMSFMVVISMYILLIFALIFLIASGKANEFINYLFSYL